MKKIVMGILVLILCTGCGSNKLQSMNYNDFKEKIENRETFVAYISKTGCTHCEAYEPTLIKVLKDYDLTVYKIDTANLTTAEKNSVTKKVGLEGTPTLIYIEKGRADIDGSLIGENTYENTVDFFKELGYIEE